MYKFIFVLCLMLLSSCDKDPKPIIVTYQLSHRADTTFQKQYKDSLQAEMDTFCVQNNSRLFNELRDSLLRDEIAKIEKLMNEK